MKKYANERVVVLSDLHFPYHHPDTFSFIKAIMTEYEPDRYVSIGDELDYHAISFHESSPSLYSAEHELSTGIKCIRKLEELMPKLDILESNHGSLVYRKVNAAGLPKRIAKGYNELLGVGPGWKWHNDMTLTMSNGRQVYFHHGRGSNILQVSQRMGLSVIQGHYHSKFNIQYWANPNDLYFAMQVGCLIDDKSLAFAYNKIPVERPLIGCGIILNGQPKLLPMILNKSGRWNNRLV